MKKILKIGLLYFIIRIIIHISFSNAYIITGKIMITTFFECILFALLFTVSSKFIQKNRPDNAKKEND